MTDLLSTVTMTVNPPDEGAIIEVSITTTLHPAVMVNAVALATDYALRGVLPDHPAHSTDEATPGSALVVGLGAGGSIVVHNPEVLNGLGVIVLPRGVDWDRRSGL